MATYYATKSYVVSLTNALAEELKLLGSRAQVHALCPGPVNTEFNDVANVKFSLRGISARECVSYCIDEADKGKIIIVPNMMVSSCNCFKVCTKRDSTRHIGTQSKE